MAFLSIDDSLDPLLGVSNSVYQHIGPGQSHAGCHGPESRVGLGQGLGLPEVELLREGGFRITQLGSVFKLLLK